MGLLQAADTANITVAHAILIAGAEVERCGRLADQAPTPYRLVDLFPDLLEPGLGGRRMVGHGLGHARVPDRVSSLRDQRDLDGHQGSDHLAGAAPDDRIERVVGDRGPAGIQVVDGRPATVVGIEVVNGTVPGSKGVFHARGDHPPQKIDINGVIGIPHGDYRVTVRGTNTELVRMGHTDPLSVGGLTTAWSVVRVGNFEVHRYPPAPRGPQNCVSTSLDGRFTGLLRDPKSHSVTMHSLPHQARPTWGTQLSVLCAHMPW